MVGWVEKWILQNNVGHSKTSHEIISLKKKAHTILRELELVLDAEAELIQLFPALAPLRLHARHRLFALLCLPHSETIQRRLSYSSLSLPVSCTTCRTEMIREKCGSYLYVLPFFLGDGWLVYIISGCFTRGWRLESSSRRQPSLNPRHIIIVIFLKDELKQGGAQRLVLNVHEPKKKQRGQNPLAAWTKELKRHKTLDVVFTGV
jgi:hypothetical protein